jgi:hypothetical protein
MSASLDPDLIHLALSGKKYDAENALLGSLCFGSFRFQHRIAQCIEDIRLMLAEMPLYSDVSQEPFDIPADNCQR